jgi:hypothetical protein
MKHIAKQFPLLEVPPMESPRLKWLDKHGVKIEHCPKVKPGDEDEFGNELYPYIAHAFKSWACGATEQEAIKNLAVKNGWKLWNEL